MLQERKRVSNVSKGSACYNQYLDNFPSIQGLLIYSPQVIDNFSSKYECLTVVKMYPLHLIMYLMSSTSQIFS